MTIGRAELRDGSGVFQFADPGLAPTLRDLIQQMVITSDNTATDVMATRVGGVDALNVWLAESGYKMRKINRGREIRRKLLARLDPRFRDITAEETTGLQYAASDNPLFAHYRSLFTGERARWLTWCGTPPIAAAGPNARLMVEDRNIWLGDMTARDIGRMLEGSSAKPSCLRQRRGIRTFMRRQLAALGVRKSPGATSRGVPSRAMRRTIPSLSVAQIPSLLNSLMPEPINDPLNAI